MIDNRFRQYGIVVHLQLHGDHINLENMIAYQTGAWIIAGDRCEIVDKTCTPCQRSDSIWYENGDFSPAAL